MEKTLVIWRHNLKKSVRGGTRLQYNITWRYNIVWRYNIIWMYNITPGVLYDSITQNILTEIAILIKNCHCSLYQCRYKLMVLTYTTGCLYQNPSFTWFEVISNIHPNHPNHPTLGIESQHANKSNKLYYFLGSNSLSSQLMHFSQLPC